ncbi:putative ribosome-binding factor A, mitochondrial [Tribolium madens]|uniref:putative ribosome-binding factor A, mitochondrial n=1 Tax=Tribolium madens TaxID=41895 RepID=UPI001CF76750|nr:putative ribosome-binding factor A, mitochondrial [Tribolium madens]XP_044265212.1 putative ribosome-binding factor A, mitochondrial [Tribolium madens]XP_044265213.1 putative ribosome-binding factor A, mitochondrial [Tribolium madens]XP_044265214.1 putative ribosome-binding factor A, mitochondrial [Tribolium madens]
MLRSFLLSSRSFHTSTFCSAKLGRVMKKVMGQSSKKKKIFTEVGILPTAESFSKGSQEGKFSGNARRVSVLNKLFMRHITDLIATGEYSSEFEGHEIEINRVQIAPDYKGLNVFWVAKGTQDDEIVEKLLKKNAGFLRHELSSLRLVGAVPMIHFVKDKHYAQIAELDSRLAKADFGEDHVPTEMVVKLKSQLELFTSLPCNVKDKVQDVEQQFLGDEITEEEELPPMPQDVLGLDRLQILNRIKKSMKKSEASHRLKNEESDLVHTINENPIEYTSNKERREAFKNFLEKRELMRSKEKKLDKNYLPDIEYIKEELESHSAEDDSNLEMYEEQDYIFEDEDHKN